MTIVDVLNKKNGTTAQTISEAVGGYNGMTIADSLNILHKCVISTDIPDSVDLLGKVASDLQEDVTIMSGKFYGTLHYVTGYTGFSGDVEEQQGNYLVFKVVPPEGLTIGTNITIKVNGAALDSDGIMILRAKNAPLKNKIIVTASKDGYETLLWKLDPTGLVLEINDEVHTVTYNANGGTGEIEPDEVPYGNSVVLPDGSDYTPPEGKEFLGWAKTSTAQSATVVSPYTPDRDITLYAVWTDVVVEPDPGE